MAHHHDRGMATAEYAVGTCGAVGIALVLHRLGALGIDGPWLDGLWERVRDALTWRSLFGGVPRLRLP